MQQSRKILFSVINPFHLKTIQYTNNAIKRVYEKDKKAMKRKVIAFALVIAAFVSVSSGCYVGYGYGYRYHHYHRWHDRY
jgi:hypothetical protein